MLSENENTPKETLLLSQTTPLPPSRQDYTAVISGSIITLIWVVLAWSYLDASGWWSMRFEMTPPEYFSFAAGLLAPVAFIWIAAAYFASHRRYVREAETLRAYMAEFMNPTAKSKLYTRSLLDNIKEQTADLNAVYEKLSTCTDSVEKVLGDRISAMDSITRTLENTVSQSAVKVEAKTKELAQTCALASTQTDQSLTLLQTNLSSLQTAAKETTDAVSFAGETLKSDAAFLKQTGDVLTDGLLRLTQDVRDQGTLLRTASEKARDVLSEQTGIAAVEIAKHAADLTAVANQVHEKLADQAVRIKQDIKEQLHLITDSGHQARDNMAAITVSLEEQTDLLRSMSDRARENTEQMVAGLEKRTQIIEDVFARQNEIITGKDERLSETSAKLLETFKEQNTVLDQEAERIVARFRTIETTLDTYINEINAASSTAVEQISTVSEALDDKAELIAATAGAVHGQLTGIGEEVDLKTQLLSVALKNMKTNAETVSETLDTQTSTLSAALDTALEKLETLKEMFESGIQSVDKNMTQTGERADSVCTRLLKHAAELSDLSGALVSQAIVSETSLAQQQKYISNASARIEEVKSGLKQQSEDLISIADLLEARTAETVTNLERRLEDTIGKSSQVTDKFAELNTALANKIHALDLSAQQTISINTMLREELNRHKDLLDSSAQRVAAYTEEVTAEIARQTTQMDISSDLLKNRAEKAVGQLDEQFRKLDQDAQHMLSNATTAAAGLADNAEKMESLFRKQSETLADVSEKLAEQTSKAATMLREQSEQADNDLERLVSRIRLIEEGLSVQTKELSNVSELMVSQLETVGSTLTMQAGSLTNLSNAAKNRISDATALFTDKAKEISVLMKDITAQSTESVERMDQKQVDFTTSADILMTRMENLKSEIAVQTDSLQKQSAKSTQQALMVRDSMQRHILDLGDVANMVTTQSRLGEASLSHQIAYLKEAAEDVMAHIHTINEAVRQNTNDLLTASSRIGFELDAMGENLRRRNDEASKTAEDSLNRSKTAALFLEEKAALLAQMTEQVIVGLNSAGEEFNTQTNRLEVASEIAREQLETTGDTFLVQSHQISRLSEEAQKAIKNCGVVLRERAADFNKTAEDTNSRVRMLNETVRQIGKEFEEMSNKGVIQIDLAGQRLRAMISEIAGNSERIAAEVRKSGEQFVDQSDLLSIAADDALKRLQELLTLMRQNATEIHESGEKISAQSIKLGGAFNRQVQALISASRSAEEYISALDKKKEEADTERFMKDASFIIEKLQSLGVDIARLFTPNVEEDLWKRYYSGDRSAFIRYLSRAVDKNQVRKMSEKLTEDSEFREYVSKYMGTFEGILSRAQENERADVLTAVLLGSEAGRLYMVLSRIFNKEA